MYLNAGISRVSTAQPVVGIAQEWQVGIVSDTAFPSGLVYTVHWRRKGEVNWTAISSGLSGAIDSGVAWYRKIILIYPASGTLEIGISLNDGEVWKRYSANVALTSSAYLIGNAAEKDINSDHDIDIYVVNHGGKKSAPAEVQATVQMGGNLDPLTGAMVGLGTPFTLGPVTVKSLLPGQHTVLSLPIPADKYKVGYMRIVTSIAGGVGSVQVAKAI